jgi:uncharacterized membrane protein YeaQ/YmgE (transglycosylase-associated protein family)
MEHQLHEVTGFTVLRPYKIEVSFDDGKRQEIDFDGVLEGQVYGPLKDPELFSGVKLDPEMRNLVWPNGADFDPEILHDWPERRTAMLKAAEKWKICSPTPEVPRAFELRELCLYLVVGIAAGVISQRLSPGSNDLFARILLGTVGSVAAGILGRLIPINSAASKFEPLPYASAALGALIFLLMADRLFVLFYS